ncbi:MULTISPECIES: xanthine dehydrogenase family protein molybdopterin-binding subunit [unclassified Beijerinckia]|uniref:xanthine dehydrogenase family protein molybdopterin-binding subunit n=1 Tax=unclassified Beijerinckia TaxID=2638183 RepID=UPI00089834AE|nr:MULTISPECIES: xanthine dehydrogenase family protein molybdopterin-binding subunit [unclassified Beijerinckia]MDH7799158.1 carbon-monoxide dehydrogenase large subunit [Beijerinckia sp. GAS462]SED93332.1 xanthine dehydrogenase, molybdenum binding subunit apoprotein [Beijerinckia sp. 28-YEA-48]
MQAEEKAPRYIGHAVARLEDEALLRGQGCFVDDIELPGMLHGAFLRSPLAHGRIRSIDTAAAKSLDGVRAVLTYADLRALLTLDRIPLAMPSAAIRYQVDPFVLARDEVCHVGEPIALVIATSRHIAEDAIGLIALDLEALPVVVDPRSGLQPDAPRARLECADNLVARTKAQYGDVDGAFARAAHVIHEHFHLHKGGGHSIEPRGLVARYEPMERLLTVWDSTQMPHQAKRIFVATLGLDETQVRVVAPDVGGGFGPKFIFYPEELAVAAAAVLLKTPVKWIEDRLESFTATTQERDQYWDIELAADKDGKLLGIRGHLIHDHGAYTPYGIALPYNSATNLLGPYVLPAYHLDISLCLTNLVPATPTRGAGRPQGTFIMERLLDRLAKQLHVDRAEIRSRNLIQPDQMPYRTSLTTRDGGAMIYDSGDYVECQRRALELAGWSDFEVRRAEARRQGKHLGIGLANYVEGSGRGPFESAAVRIGPSGKVIVSTGAAAQGQGTVTMLAQLVAEVLGVSPASISVIAGDTSASALGLGAFASRQAVTAGNAAHQAAIQIREKILKVASEALEASPDDLELEDGRVYVKGVPGLGRSFAQIATSLEGMPGFPLPAGMTPGLSAVIDFQPAALTYCNGTHIAEVEVDAATATVHVRRYVVVHDCGRLINPMIVDGQVVGGVVHGIGSALYERMIYGEDGQPHTGTWVDYLMCTADVLPRIEVHHMESPTPLNPLGVKGAGESGTIAALAVVASAVEDALRDENVKVCELPITPARLHRLLHPKTMAATS